MTVLALVAFWGTVGFVVLQATLVALFVRKLNRNSVDTGAVDTGSVDTESIAKSDLKTAIILCVRGVDPSLKDCLDSLIEQGASDQKVFVVGDSESDPAIEFVRSFATKHPQKIGVLINEELHEHCGLKCSNLIYAIGQLESEYDIFLLVDADAVVPDNWLHTMTAPFADPEVCVTSGVRWLDVSGSRMGTWVRFIWNTAAIVQMVCYRIPWGGSLGIRTAFLRNADVLDAWSRGFCEDTMLQSLARKNGAKIEVVSEAVIHSAEETSLGKSIPWISRQLLTARLHHPFWPLVLGHGLMTLLFSFGLPILLMITLFQKSFVAAGWLAAAYAILQLGNLWLLNWIESPVRKRSGQRATFWKNPIMFLIGIPVTQVSYVMAVVKAVLARKVEWRKINYQIRGKRIKRLDYEPYQQSTKTESL